MSVPAGFHQPRPSLEGAAFAAAGNCPGDEKNSAGCGKRPRPGDKAARVRPRNPRTRWARGRGRSVASQRKRKRWRQRLPAVVSPFPPSPVPVPLELVSSTPPTTLHKPASASTEHAREPRPPGAMTPAPRGAATRPGQRPHFYPRTCLPLGATERSPALRRCTAPPRPYYASSRRGPGSRGARSQR